LAVRRLVVERSTNFVGREPITVAVSLTVGDFYTVVTGIANPVAIAVELRRIATNLEIVWNLVVTIVIFGGAPTDITGIAHPVAI